jgi:hypothetical protein
LAWDEVYRFVLSLYKGMKSSCSWLGFCWAGNSLGLLGGPKGVRGFEFGAFQF